MSRIVGKTPLPHEIDILRKTVLNWRTSVRMDRKDAS